MLPDWRGQATDKQGKWAEKSKRAWAERCRNFLSTVKAAAVKKDTNITKTKKANWVSILALDRALEATWGLGLKRFVPKRLLGPLAPDTERVLVPKSALPPSIQASSSNRTCRAMLKVGDTHTLEAIYSGHREVLHITLDQGSIGWPGRGWLLNRCGVRGTRWPDPCHRHVNNVNDALQTSGLAIFKSEALLLTNTNAGPFGEAANYDKWVGATEEWLASTTVEDPLFEALYGYISWDLHSGALPGTFGTAEHKEHIRQTIQATVQSGKGDVVQLNRWFALWQKVRPVFRLWSVYLLCNLIQCLQKGYYHHHTELSLFAVGEDDARTALSAAGVAGAPVATPRSRAVGRGGGANLDALRGKCHNTVHLCTEILANRASRAVLMCLDSIIRPLEVFHNQMIKVMKTAGGRKLYNISLSVGGQGEHIATMASIFFDFALMVNVGIIASRPGRTDYMLPPALRQAALKSIYAFWRELASAEVMQMMLHSCHMPGLAFTQLSTVTEEREAGAQLMMRLWSRLQCLEAAAQHDSHLRAIARDLEWPTSQWCRELLLSLQECDGEMLPDDMLQQVLACSLIASTTKPVEDSFNEARAQVEGVRNKKQAAYSAWHDIAASAVAKEFDLDPVFPTPEDEVRSTPTLPVGIFSAAMQETELSLSGAGIDQEGYIQDTLHPGLSPGRHLQLGVANSALLDCPAPGALALAWQSLIPVEGCFLFCTGLQEVCGLVLKVTPMGVVLWRGTVCRVGRCSFVVLDRTVHRKKRRNTKVSRPMVATKGTHSYCRGCI